MDSQITCLVTLHGIGFEQPPQPAIENSGYADPLHQHLHTRLGTLLSDDPQRTHNQPGSNGAIYVESRWLDEQEKASREEGLKRLGTWSGEQQIDITNAPLTANNASIAHVALVYSNLEPTGPQAGAALLSANLGLFSISHYASAAGLLHMALKDALALLKHPASREEMTSALPRTDLSTRSAHTLGLHGQLAPDPSPGLLTILRTLEEDVACYVCYNEERERVRSFVREALTRLAYRPDVANLVINTHSNGTVIAFDVLRHLPEVVTRKIKAFITAGSPLRKYVDLFHWGNQIQSLASFEPWYNFWDRYDPVADPLEPPLSWRVGKPFCPSPEKLFSRIDLRNEQQYWVQVQDREVDNLAKSRAGGLQAHNYWDNEEEFVKALAKIIQATSDFTTIGEPVAH